MIATWGVLRQVRLALDRHILDSLEIAISWRARQRKKVASLLKSSSFDYQRGTSIIESLIKSWKKDGYPFTVPQLRRYSLDFSASTENSTGQGYWFTQDEEREDEIFLHLKLPPGIDGTHHEESPYKTKTLTFRFLDWLPRSASGDRRKVVIAEESSDFHRAERLTFRAAKFEDMHQQLMNTIQLQHATHRLSRLKQKKNSDPKEIIQLEKEVKGLRNSRRSAPPKDSPQVSKSDTSDSFPLTQWFGELSGSW